MSNAVIGCAGRRKGRRKWEERDVLEKWAETGPLLALDACRQEQTLLFAACL